ncbi:hypothetical protein DPMN_048902 [Dreissena polymorpha]|uniref:Uncharacterized protein n=1 Tax=Dreissena polymorpha TaxID=45954 RepID=A0A9D4I4D1_DREPO|nr:hypothetical protein DPMN_048902 [Dreissena polymorpha]
MFHDDRKINVAFQVLTRTYAPPPGVNVFQQTRTIFELIQDIIGTNVLTKFYEDWTINVTFRVKNDPLPGGRVFQPNGTIFELAQDIIGSIFDQVSRRSDHKYDLYKVLTRQWPAPCFSTNQNHFNLIQEMICTNVLTKFHEDWTIHVTDSVYRKNAPPLGGNDFQPTGTIFDFVKNIIEANRLTNFNEDRTINVASRVRSPKITRYYWENLLTNHVFQANIIIFEILQDIIQTNHLTKFHEDWTINVASTVLTRFYFSHLKKCPAPWRPYIIGMNLLTKFHEDWTMNVVSRVFTRFYYSHIYSHLRKNVPPLDSHVFQANLTIFKLIQDIIGTNLLTKKNAPPLGSHERHVLTKFHEDWTKNVTSRRKLPRPLATIFSPIWTILELVRDINVSTKFHDDWANVVTFRVFTRNTAPPPGGHVFQRAGTIFELNQHINLASNVTSTVFTIFELSRCINGTNVLTKFHEDRTINVASRVLARQNVDDGRRTTDKRRSQKLTMSTLCSGELKYVMVVLHGKQGIAFDKRKYAPPPGDYVF